MKSKRKLWIPITAAVLAVVTGAAALLVPRFLQPEPVPVYAVNMIGYTDYYSGNSESYGVVTTDRVQTAYVSDTQTITEILVYEGQSVKKGDVLYTYDTTLSDLALERKSLSIEQLEVTLKTAEQELKELKAMRPIVYNEDTSINKSKYTKSPEKESFLNTVYSSTTGRSRMSPLYYWMEYGSSSMSGVVSESLIEYLFDQAAGTDPEQIYVVFQSTKGNKTDTEYEYQYGVCFTKVWKEVPVETEPAPETPGTDDPGTEPPVEENPGGENPGAENPGEGTPGGETPGDEPPAAEDPGAQSPGEDLSGGDAADGETPAASEPAPTVGDAAPPADLTPPEETVGVTTAAAVAAAPAADPSDPAEPSDPAPTQPTKPQTQKVFDGYSISFFEPSSIDEDNSSIDWNSGFTSAELTTLRSEKQAEINELKFDIKMAKAELKIMEKEADSGRVLAQFNGVVTGITTPLDAAAQNVPLMKLIGGGGYYVEGTVSELDLGTVQPGQSITVTAWDTGVTVQGTVVEVGSYPAADQGYGAASVSYYPYRVFIDQSADLMEGYYVSLIIESDSAAEGTLYLQNAFLRTDGNRSYVYVRDAEGLLEKRYVDCGISQDGYMTPIYSGLTDQDFIAFPYGNEVTEDAPTREGTMDELYGY